MSSSSPLLSGSGSFQANSSGKPLFPLGLVIICFIASALYIGHENTKEITFSLPQENLKYPPPPPPVVARSNSSTVVVKQPKTSMTSRPPSRSRRILINWNRRNKNNSSLTSSGSHANDTMKTRKPASHRRLRSRDRDESLAVAIVLGGELKSFPSKGGLLTALGICLRNILAAREPPRNRQDRPYGSTIGSLKVYFQAASERKRKKRWLYFFHQMMMEDEDLNLKRPFAAANDSNLLVLRLALKDLASSPQSSTTTNRSPLLRETVLDSLCGTVSHVRSILWNFKRRSGGQNDTGSSTPKHNSNSHNNSTHLISLIAPLGASKTHSNSSEVVSSVVKHKFEVFVNSSGLADPSPPGFQFLEVVGGSYWVRSSLIGGVVTAWNSFLPEAAENTTSSNTTSPPSLSDDDDFYKFFLPTYAAYSSTTPAFGSTAEIGRAVKPFPIVFPQFHSTPENDKFWGKDFTEWTLLNRSLSSHMEKQKKGEAVGDLENIQRPLSVEKSGLGYYNLTSVSTRRRWSKLAGESGVQGFMWYHYWFNSRDEGNKNKSINNTNTEDTTRGARGLKTLYRIQEMMAFEDREPDLPFFFSWANEPWNRNWDGDRQGQRRKGNDDKLIEQDYGDEADWTEHFEYLQPFFEHPRYLKINGTPVFAIYRIGHMHNKFEPMMDHFNKLAEKNLGIQGGLHIIATLGGFLQEDDLSGRLIAKGDLVKSTFHFWPQLCAPGLFRCTRRVGVDTIAPEAAVLEGTRQSDADVKKSKNSSQFSSSSIQAASTEETELYFSQVEGVKRPQHWGASSGFDVRIRKPKEPPFLHLTPDQFEAELRNSFHHQNHRPSLVFSSNQDPNNTGKGSVADYFLPNLFFINAWNEWNEQAVLEPSDKYKDGYLRALSRSLMQIPAKIIVLFKKE